jgi:anion-transporting  ArsA/GET3 family ATPase
MQSAQPLATLMATKEIIVTCGSGGVGKTTTAAALAVTAAARRPGRVLVVTVDPARRLADALGVGGLGNTARQVPRARFVDAGVEPKGELFAAMLDTKQSWDDLVRRHAPDPSTARQILTNPLYDNIAGRFAQGHEYIAMERLYEIHNEGDYDLVVVDTPPSRNAIDFLDAPDRLAEFFSSRLLRWLIVPYRSRMISAASRPFYQIADRILGTQFLKDIGEFFLAFQSMYDGFVARAEAVSRLLRDDLTAFVVVTTLESGPALEAQFFVETLRERQLHCGAVVANKVLPAMLLDERASDGAAALQRCAGELVLELAKDADDPTSRARAQRVIEEVAASYEKFAQIARRQQELLGRLRAGHEATVTAPLLAEEVTDLPGLLELGRLLLDPLPAADDLNCWLPTVRRRPPRPSGQRRDSRPRQQ